MNGANVEKVYRLCQKRERDRERSCRKSRQGEFEASMLSLERQMAACGDGDNPMETWISDNGAGVEAIISACDREAPGGDPDRIEPKRSRRDILRNARKRLKRAHPELLEVFNLIVKNGKNRKESIWALMTSRARRNGPPQKCCTGAT